MTAQQLERRRRVMTRSMMLGHCICDVRQPCPCDLFKQKSVCHCAGESMPATGGPVRLTEHVRNAGCASKISKSVLQEVLGGLPQIDDPRVVIGASAGDDAGVIMLGHGNGCQASILTVDVFCPSVDDPFTFGQIAAANSLSDIYAMGGVPEVALSIIGFPIHVLPPQTMREILRGGVEKMKEAGVCVIGGHSINDEEVKCGFAVVGTSPRDQFVRNVGAQVGDQIVLTKPLGSGILAFANQLKRAPADAMEQAAKSMASLNRLAGEAMARHHAHAATDITGFSLLGHMAEIVRNSGVEVEIDFDRIPLFDTVDSLARQDVLPGAVERNRESVPKSMLDLSQLATAQQAVLFGPETSGGMLVFLSPPCAEAYIAELRGGGEAHMIGRVTQSRRGGRIAARTAQASNWQSLAASTIAPAASPSPASCCASATPADNDDLPPPAAAGAFKDYMSQVNVAGELDTMQKKLIALALSVVSKCEPCVKVSARAAKDAGASNGQIAEAVALGIAFGGASAAMFYNTLRNSGGSKLGGGGQ